MSCGSHPNTSEHSSICCTTPVPSSGSASSGSEHSCPCGWEKGFGTWFREYRPIYTALEAGLTSYIKLEHEFIGRAAHEAELATGPGRRLVTLVVEPDPDDPADAIGDEPIWHDDEVVGWVTSGGYAHHSKASVALGYVPAHLADAGSNGNLEIEIIGRRRPAHLQLTPIYDPEGRRMRQ